MTEIFLSILDPSEIFIEIKSTADAVSSFVQFVISFEKECSHKKVICNVPKTLRDN